MSFTIADPFGIDDLQIVLWLTCRRPLKCSFCEETYTLLGLKFSILRSLKPMYGRGYIKRFLHAYKSFQRVSEVIKVLRGYRNSQWSAVYILGLNSFWKSSLLRRIFEFIIIFSYRIPSRRRLGTENHLEIFQGQNTLLLTLWKYVQLKDLSGQKRI